MGKTENDTLYQKAIKQMGQERFFEKNDLVIVESKDRYGRYIGKVQYGDKDLGEELLRHGLAWHFVRYSSDKNSQKIEDEARVRKLGYGSNIPFPPGNGGRGFDCHYRSLTSPPTHTSPAPACALLPDSL